MASEIRTQINRQGWRIVDRPAAASHPRIDHAKRQVNADSTLDLARAYLELRGWPRPTDFAGYAAQACAVNRWLRMEKSGEFMSYPAAADDTQRQIITWLDGGHSEIVPEITRCHESADNAEALAEKIRKLLAKPELLTPIPVRHTFKVRA